MRITISLTPEQVATLDSMMKDDLQTNRSTYVVYLMSQELKNRTKGKPGRPKKEQDDADEEEAEPDYTNDLPKNVSYFGEMIGPREAADKEEMRSHFMPK